MQFFSVVVGFLLFKRINNWLADVGINILAKVMLFFHASFPF